jgi:NAD(P)-dependent dehydrogenase (short-subunit alcohol dehydrogenase family)
MIDLQSIGDEDLRRVLITGVSRGIGKAVAEKFLSEDWLVTGTSTSGQSSWTHQNLIVHRLDMFDPQTIRMLAETVSQSQDHLDVLINNAGICLEPRVGTHMSIDLLRKTLEVNLIGLIDLTERLLPYIKDGGSIMNVSSGAGSLTDFGRPTQPSYKISKVGVNMYTRILASRLKDRGIAVSSVLPGWTRTDMGGGEAQRDATEPAKEIYDLAVSKAESGYAWYQGNRKAW